MEKIMVRVKPGHRLHEAGATRLPGQTFWTTRDRLSSLIDEVEIVSGVAPLKVTVAAMEPPAPMFVPSGIPSPEVRLSGPRTASSGGVAKKGGGGKK